MTCQPPEVLRKYALGELPPAESAALKEHLEGCTVCAARLSSEGLPTRTGAPAQRPQAMPPPPPEPLPLQIGRYRVLDRLGEGAMGTVYSAYHPDLDRRVAIKMIKTGEGGGQMTTGQQERLVVEARAMARLGHPNVVVVHDVGSQGGRPYLVMELVDGESLAQRLKRGAVPLAEALSIIVQSGRGLAAAHRAGIIHRDFKPANVLLSRDLRVRVADFGVARLPQATEPQPGALDFSASDGSSSSTLPGQVVGTLSFMAPERIAGQPADERSDQFAFCITAFEVLYGRRPFDLTLPLAERFNQLAEVPSRGESRHVRAAIRRGLSYDPAQRFASMQALLDELERERLTAGRVAPWVALAAVLAGSAGALWMLSRPQPTPGCSPLELDTDGFWGPSQRRRLADGFHGTLAPEADKALRLVEARLDGYAAEWRQEAAGACALAAKPDGKATRDGLGRLDCLSQRRLEAKALIDVLSHPRAEMIDRAPFAAAALTPPSRCAAPNAAASLPRAPDAAGLREQVELARYELSTVQALALAGQQQEALSRLTALHARTQKLGFRPLEAEVAFGLAEVNSMIGDGKAGLEWSTAARDAALKSDLSMMAADSCALMAFFGAYSGKLELSDEWLKVARVLLERAGGDPLVEARLENSLAVLQTLRGEHKESLAHQLRAFELRRQVLGPRHPRTLNFLSNVAASYEEQCDGEKALELLRSFEDPEAIPNAVSVYARALNRETEVMLTLGKVDEAERVLQLAVTLAPVAGTGLAAERLAIWARLRLEQGRTSEALDLAQQAVTAARASGEEWVTYRFCLNQQVSVLLEVGDPKALSLAEQAAEKVAAAGDSMFGPWLSLARAQNQAGRPQEAASSLVKARAAAGTSCLHPPSRANLELTDAEIGVALRREKRQTSEALRQVAAMLEGQPWAGRLMHRLERLGSRP